jgi:hypothetical protein
MLNMPHFKSTVSEDAGLESLGLLISSTSGKYYPQGLNSIGYVSSTPLNNILSTTLLHSIKSHPIDYIYHSFALLGYISFTGLNLIILVISSLEK